MKSKIFTPRNRKYLAQTIRNLRKLAADPEHEAAKWGEFGNFADCSLCVINHKGVVKESCRQCPLTYMSGDRNTPCWTRAAHYLYNDILDGDFVRMPDSALSLLDDIRYGLELKKEERR